MVGDSFPARQEVVADDGTADFFAQLDLRLVFLKFTAAYQDAATLHLEGSATSLLQSVGRQGRMSATAIGRSGWPPIVTGTCWPGWKSSRDW